MSAQVRLGHKLTEAGVIPDDWEAVQLQNICTLVNGRGFKPHEWENSGLPIIRIQNLNGSNEFNYYSGRYDQKILVESEQLLFAWSGSRGTSFGPHVWKGGTALLNYHTWKIVINESKINARYFFYALKDLTACIEKDAHGASALVHTQKCEMEKYYVRVPPIELQQKIANCLSDMDELINGLDQLIAKKRDIKQAVTQQLLTGRQRLPGFSGEWEVKRLGDIFDIFAGGDFDPSSSSTVQDEKHPFPIFSNSVTDAGLYGFCSYSVYPKDSITVTARGSVGFANYRSAEYTAIGRVLVLQPKLEVSCQFYADFINSKISFVVESTGVPQLTAPQISKYEIPIPACAEQVAITTIFSDMDSELMTLESRRDKARQLKQGMMQELLTGRIRLSQSSQEAKLC